MFCNCGMFSVVNVYLNHLKFCVGCIMVEGMSVLVNVIVSLLSVMSPPPALCNLSAFTARYMCLGGVCSLVVVLGLSWYPMLWVRLFRWL